MGSGGIGLDPAPSSSQIFNDQFPYYLSIGMTYDQYWREDCLLVKAYRKADDIRRKRINQEAWLQGAYFYHALCAASPLLHAFAKEGTEAMPYMEKPIAITRDEIRLREDERMIAAADGFAAFAAEKNKERRDTEREVSPDGY